MLENLSTSTNQIEIFVKEILDSVNSLRGKLDSFADSVSQYRNVVNAEIQMSHKIFSDNINYNALEKSKISFKFNLFS